MPANQMHLCETIANVSDPHTCTLVKKDYLQHANQTVDSEVYTQCSILAYLALIDSYDAWLYLRASHDLPAIPDDLIFQLRNRSLVLRLPKGSSLNDRIRNACAEVKESFSPETVSQEDLAAYVKEILERCLTSSGSGPEPFLGANSLKQLRDLQRYTSYFNFTANDQLSTAVMFGPRPAEEYQIYKELLDGQKYFVGYKTLSSFYNIPFGLKLKVLGELSPESSMNRKLDVYGPCNAVNDFYSLCSKNEDAVVSVLERLLPANKTSVGA